MKYGKMSAAALALVLSVGAASAAEPLILNNKARLGVLAAPDLSKARAFVNPLKAPPAAAADKGLPMNTALKSGSIAGGAPSASMGTRAFGSFGTSSRLERQTNSPARSFSSIQGKLFLPDT